MARKMPEHAAPELIAEAVAFHVELVADPKAGAEWVRKRLEAEGWTFAKTMADNPHWYTLRDTWVSPDMDGSDPWKDFYACCLFIRTEGETEWFPSVSDGFPYVGLRLGEFYYWTMGYPLRGHRAGPTYLINRKPIIKGF